MIETNMRRAGAWYALAVNSGTERRTRQRIIDRLDREKIPMGDMQILCPEDEVTITSPSGERQKATQLSLPGYLLLHSRRRVEDRALLTIKRVKGVIDFLGNQDRPTPLAPREISQILGHEPTAASSDGVSEQPRKAPVPFSVGDQVKITDGPMADFGGELLEVNEKAGKAKVELMIFGRATATEVGLNQLRKEK